MHDIPLDSHESKRTVEEAEAMMRYMLHHNKSHAEELGELGHLLEHLGFDFSALEVRSSAESLAEASGHLEKALYFLHDDMSERYGGRG